MHDLDKLHLLLHNFFFFIFFFLKDQVSATESSKQKSSVQAESAYLTGENYI